MLKELCKKFNMKEQEMVEEQIQESYNTIFARRKRWKGLSRLKKRQLTKSYFDSMSLYEETLGRLVEVNGDGNSYRQGDEQLNFRIREGEVVAIRCPDNTHFYRTCYLKRNPLSGNLQKFVSNPVMGMTPDGMREMERRLFWNSSGIWQMGIFLHFHSVERCNEDVQRVQSRYVWSICRI